MGDALLRGYRVVEIAHPLTEYAGLVLAGLGADVYLVEPPQGSATTQPPTFAGTRRPVTGKSRSRPFPIQKSLSSTNASRLSASGARGPSERLSSGESRSFQPPGKPTTPGAFAFKFPAETCSKKIPRLFPPASSICFIPPSQLAGYLPTAFLPGKAKPGLILPERVSLKFRNLQIFERARASREEATGRRPRTSLRNKMTAMTGPG